MTELEFIINDSRRIDGAINKHAEKFDSATLELLRTLTNNIRYRADRLRENVREFADAVLGS